MKTSIAWMAAALAALSACASSADFTASTSAATGIAADQITIGEVSGSAMSHYSWRASTPRGEYDCTTDAMRHYTSCSPVASDDDSTKAPAQ